MVEVAVGSGKVPESRPNRKRQIEMFGKSIMEDACPRTPDNISEYDSSYMVHYSEEVQERRPQNTQDSQFRSVREARMRMPYVVPREKSIAYRFWNGFHSDFYLSVLYNAKHDRVLRVKYIDWEHIDSKSDKFLKNVVNACKRLGLYDIMGFQHNWNTEILYQFSVTYYCETSCDVMHWMTEGRHYMLDYVTFARLLGFDFEDRSFSEIHDERNLTDHDSLYVF